MQILMKNIHRKIRSKSDRKMFRQMKAQIVMIGRLKLQIQPTVNEPPPDDLPSSRSFGLAEEQVLQRRRQLEGDVRLERPQQVAVGDVGKRYLDRRRAAAFVPRGDDERLAVGAPFSPSGTGALRPHADEGADDVSRTRLVEASGLPFDVGEALGDRTREHVGQPRPCGPVQRRPRHRHLGTVRVQIALEQDAARAR